MLQTLVLVISLEDQGLDAAQALEIRNALEDQIEDNTDAEVVAGGARTDGAEIDLQLTTADTATTMAFIQGLLAHAGLDEGYSLEVAS